jgi:hypothetical protein
MTEICHQERMALSELIALRAERDELKKRVEEMERDAIPLDMDLSGIDWKKAAELLEKCHRNKPKEGGEPVRERYEDCHDILSIEGDQ